jgi:hypothetical protein
MYFRGINKTVFIVDNFQILLQNDSFQMEITWRPLSSKMAEKIPHMGERELCKYELSAFY